MFQPFLAWLYKQDLTDLDKLPGLVTFTTEEASFDYAGYRRPGAEEPKAEEITADDITRNLPKIMAGKILDQTCELGTLRRRLAAATAALTPGQKEMAEAILRSMAEEAANLRPMFDAHERAVIVMALEQYSTRRRLDDHSNMEVNHIVEKLDMMEAVERAENDPPREW